MGKMNAMLNILLLRCLQDTQGNFLSSSGTYEKAKGEVKLLRVVLRNKLDKAHEELSTVPGTLQSFHKCIIIDSIGM